MLGGAQTSRSEEGDLFRWILAPSSSASSASSTIGSRSVAFASAVLLPPKLSDAEVLTIEMVGEFLGLDTNKDIHLFFRRHYAEWFPTLGAIHRTTFARQAPNLWKVKEHLWQEFLALAPRDPAFALIDSMPLPACLFARAYRCKRFRGEAAFGRTRFSGRPSTAFGCTCGWVC